MTPFSPQAMSFGFWFGVKAAHTTDVEVGDTVDVGASVLGLGVGMLVGDRLNGAAVGLVGTLLGVEVVGMLVGASVGYRDGTSVGNDDGATVITFVVGAKVGTTQTLVLRFAAECEEVVKGAFL